MLLILGGVVYSGLPGRALYAVRRSWFHATADKGFVVRAIYIEGRENIDPAQLRSVLGIRLGDPMMGVDLRDEAAALRGIPWVRDVRVERRLPDTIFIKLTERKPLALWQSHGKIRLIDENGVVLTGQIPPKFSSLPLVVGDDAPQHAAALQQEVADISGLGGQVDSASWLPDQRWDLHLKNGQTLQLPAGEEESALRRLSSPEGKAALADREVTVIDLRAADRISVRTKPSP